MEVGREGNSTEVGGGGDRMEVGRGGDKRSEHDGAVVSKEDKENTRTGRKFVWGEKGDIEGISFNGCGGGVVCMYMH